MPDNAPVTFKIGEVAEKAGVNRETVRYYERRELIDEPGRRRSGYRIFTQRHIDQIRFIKRAQELGFTLSEIKELLALKVDNKSSCAEIRDKAEDKYRSVARKIEDLKRIRSVLSDLIDSCKKESPTDECVILNALEGKNEVGADLR